MSPTAEAILGDMDVDTLRATQAPLKATYREDPSAAAITLHATGTVGAEEISCSVDTGAQLAKAGLHPGSGGDGTMLCSGDMLLEALVACAGVTMRAVATSMGLDVRGAIVRAEGDLDFRGTLGVDKAVPVGFQAIRLHVDLDGSISEEDAATLLRLTERYCVVLQTLRSTPPVAATLAQSGRANPPA